MASGSTGNSLSPSPASPSPSAADRDCLYVGGLDTEAGSWDTACEASIFQDPWVSQSLLPRIKELPRSGGFVTAPELDLVFRSIPARGIDPAILFVQRNTRSNTVRSGAYYPERIRNEVKSVYRRQFSHDSNRDPRTDTLLAVLEQSGDTLVRERIAALLQREAALERELAATRAAIASVIDPSLSRP